MMAFKSYKSMLMLVLLIACTLPLASQNLVRMEYFVDTDPGIGNGIEVVIDPAVQVNNLSFEVDLGAVSDGLHRLFVRAKDENDRWSETAVRTFYRYTPISLTPDVAQEIIALEYFVDIDPGVGLATALTIEQGLTVENLSFDLDLSDLTDGLHVLYIRSQDAAGRWSETARRTFIRYSIPTDSEPTAANLIAAEYFIGTDPGLGSGTVIEIAEGLNVADLTFEIDLTDLTDGQHSLSIRFKDANNRWSETTRKNFLRYSINTTALPTASPIIAFEYFINADPGYSNGIAVTPTASLSFDDYEFIIDVSEANEGVENILFVRAKSEDGRWSEVVRRTFVLCDESSITPLILNNAQLNVAYNQQLAQEGLVGTVTWSVSVGSLPAGITLSSTGLLSGTPTVGGNFSITIRAAGGFCETFREYTFTVDCPNVNLSGITPVPGTIGSPYTYQMTQSGLNGAIVWGLASGSLPTGLSINSSTGLISGTPTQAGTATFTVQISGSGCVIESGTISITIEKQDQIITIEPIANVDFNVTGTLPTVEISASSTSGLALTYEVTGPATVEGNVITLSRSSGTVNVNVNQAGDDTFNPAFASTSFQVTELDPYASVGKDLISEYSIFPNPARDVLEMKIGLKSVSSVNIQLVNVQGQQLWSRQQENTQLIQTSIPLANYPRGLYFLRIEVEGKVHTEKIVLE